MGITRREFLPMVIAGGLEFSKIRKFNPLHTVFHTNWPYDPHFDSPFQAILNATVRIKRYTYLKDGNAIIRVGTGLVYKEDSDGYHILTNQHVVQNPEREGVVEEGVYVVLGEDILAPTKVKKVNVKKDFALFVSAQSELSEKVLSFNYQYLQWNNATIEIGDKLFIIGYQDGITFETSIGYVTIPKKEDRENGYNHYDVSFLSTSKRGNSGAPVLKEVKHPKLGVVYEFIGMFHTTEPLNQKGSEVTSLDEKVIQMLEEERKDMAIYKSRAVLLYEFEHMLKAT